MRRNFKIMLPLIFLLIAMTGCNQGQVKEPVPSPMPVTTISEQMNTIAPTSIINDVNTPMVTPVELSLEEKIEQRAYEIVNQMSLEEKVGQMFFARCPQDN